MSLSNYGEQFAANCLRRFFQRAITPAITNADYEGDIKKKGNILNILSFLGGITLSNYAVGTDMSVEHPADTEDQLTIDQLKYYNFDIDAVDKQFTYVEDQDSTLINESAKALEKTIDTFVLGKAGYNSPIKAGHRIGRDWHFVIGDAASTITVTTTATYGILTLVGGLSENYGDECDFWPVESTILGKGIKLTSTGTDSVWYRIAARVSSTILWVNNWDDSLEGNGLILEGIRPYQTADGKGVGATIEATNATTVTATNVYDLITDLAEVLDNDEVPEDNRHITIPPWFKKLLIQASELQPDIAMYHESVIINGRVGRVAGFDIHVAAGTRIARTTATNQMFYLDTVGTGRATYVLANHIGYITFAHKWTESRVIGAEKQFARLYQGLNLYGAKVATERRKCGAMLFCRP